MNQRPKRGFPGAKALKTLSRGLKRFWAFSKGKGKNMYLNTRPGQNPTGTGDNTDLQQMDPQRTDTIQQTNSRNTV